jgi:drug/metabolite transporter (DMT)-like permease
MNKKITGAMFLFGSTIIYGLFGIFSKQIAVFGSFSQGWIRYSIALLVISVMLVTGKFKWKKVEKKDVKWFLTWILPASFQPILSFMAFTHLPVGITYFLIYSTMITGGILSGKIFFSEKFNLEKLASVILILIGLVFIYKSDLTLITNGYVLLALTSGLIVGFWNTLTKKVSGNYPEAQMMFLDGLSTLTVSLLGFVFIKETLPSFSNPSPWLWIVGFAVSGILSSFLLIRGFKYVEAQVGSLILPMELVFASIFGFLFLGEVLQFNVYLGGFLIFLAAILPVLPVNKLRRK